ncbi:amine sulfotransferase-like [Engraulis encrasicolus]|uniref:amine sulfotransferase-like n=1 Tax=Engraulis encrasicolus TaxID=184585 RepID=UPI002FD02695
MMEELEYTQLGESLVSFKGTVFISKYLHGGIPVGLNYVDNLKSFQIRDDDVFLVSFPKSGTTWMQYILYILYEDSHPESEDNAIHNIVPHLEYRSSDYKYRREASRLVATHLPQHMTPQGLQNNKGKVIYVMRNPKDVLVSFIHFSKVAKALDDVSNIDEYFEDFLLGKVFGGSWFDHVKGWFENKNKYNILFLSYEEMKMDLRSVVERVAEFVGKTLTDEDIDKVVDRATFKNMKNDPLANYERSDMDLVLDRNKGKMLRKGTIGDWKNTLTVAQSERFDQVYQERMKGIPLHFIWDIKDIQG